MNTDDLAAPGTNPLLLFIFNEIPDAELPYIFEIVHHAHGILRSVALVQAVQHETGKAVTTEAIPDSTFRYFFTVLDSARDAGFRF